jgi:DNA-binding MarR family transcriptional regulator
MKPKRDIARVEMVSRDCIANKVRLLNRAVTGIYDEALRPFGLKISQMSVLITVSKMESASPGALGRVLHMEKSTLSRNVDRMRARGWLEVARGEDGRTIELRVSERGEQLLRDAHGAWNKAQRRAAAVLGDEGVRGITRTVDLLSRPRAGGG